MDVTALRHDRVRQRANITTWRAGGATSASDSKSFTD
jgi:hypothetical protein